MCGIAGYWGSGDTRLLKRMCDSMKHRGPDDQGYHVERQAGVGMRRLSIIDLKGGHQPVSNEEGDAAIVFNGEIYNHEALRAKLEARGHSFSTDSDTETIIHAFEEYGVDCVNELRGMFAFAILHRNGLFIARDRIGIKPLYYYANEHGFYFASEIKALYAAPGFKPEVNRGAIDEYLSYRYVPGPETLFKNVYSLPPATTLAIDKHGKRATRVYWRLPSPRATRLSDAAATQAYLKLLRESVRLRMISDVPLGAYLSGGVDSSTIVALMKEAADAPVETFSVGFETSDARVNELDAARDTAELLGTNHHETVVRAEGADWLEKIVWHLDNPLGDTAVIANYALSELARKHVTVVLSGEGADELLYGYAHYANLQRAKTARLVPRPLRQAAGHLIGVTPVAVLDKFFDYPASMGRKGRTRLAKLAGELGDEAAAYLRLVSVFDEEDKETLFAPGQREGKGAALARVKANFAERTGYEPAEKVAHHEFKTWLPDDILFKMDKITMASSIEGRVPFLDHQLAEFTAALPMRFKLRGGTNKWLLRKAAREVLPKKIAERGKHAFFMPVTDSFQARIKAIAHDALSRESVEKRGYFDYAHVEKLFSPASRKSKFLSDKQIVSLTVLELWHRQFIDAFE